MNDFTNFINAVLIGASDIAVKNFGKVSGKVKGLDNNQILTAADLEIGQFLTKQIQAKFPDHNIIDEELGAVDKGSSFTWVVDPIDGTSNFASGVPTYGIMIGLLEAGDPIAGGVALPYFSEIYLGAKGLGATCNGLPIKVSSETTLLNTLVAYGVDGHQESPDATHAEMEVIEKIVISVRNLRSSNSVFDNVLVARGSYGAYLNQTSKIWDNVAPHIIIEEAGGVCTDFFGAAMDYRQPLTKLHQNFSCCVASPEFHRQLQEIIKSSY